MELNGTVTHLCSNSFYPYIAISFKDGKVELLKTDTEETFLEKITTIILCDEEISSLNFFSGGKECVVSSFPTGQFYCVSVSWQQFFII